MRPILLDMNEMSDSREVYESRPHPFFVLFIYLLLIIVTVAAVWSAFFKIDIVVKGTGTVSAREDSSVITNTHAGAITKCNIADGETVEKGDILYEVEAKDWDLQLNNYNTQLEQNEDRLAMMEAYLSWLMDNSVDISSYKDNPYYDEYAARQNIVHLQMDLAQSEFSSQKDTYDSKLASGSSMLDYYEDEVNKLNQLSVGIRIRENTFEVTDSYYHAKLNNYITQYNNTVVQYDTTLSSLQRELDQAKKDLEDAESDISEADNKINQAQKELDAAKERIKKAQATSNSFEEQAFINLNGNISESDGVSEEVSSELEDEAQTEASSEVKENTVSEEESSLQEENNGTEESLEGDTVEDTQEDIIQEIATEPEPEADVSKPVQVIDTSGDEALISEKQAEIATAKNEKAVAEAAKKTQEALIRTKQDAITSTTLQKQTALSNLETETIAGIEASILQYQQNILSTNGTQVEMQTAQKNILEQGIQNSRDNVVQTEIQKVSTEISTYSQKKQELEAGILEVENGKMKTIVLAPVSGVVNLTSELVEGNYLSSGTHVMTIIPQEENSFLVKSYINNQDIAKIQPDMEVKYEIAAYPSSEYGSMTGSVEFVSADLKANSQDGSAYYVVETSIDDTKLYNKTGEKLDLKIGMYCETKIIVEQKSVLRFLLEKINLMD